MKTLTLCVSILALSITSSFAQFADRLVPHMGFVYNIMTVQDSAKSYPAEIVPYYNFHLGTYITLAHKNDVLSVGVDPSLNLGISLRQSIGFIVQAPVFVMGRVGANATSYNQQMIGFGAGVGMVNTYWHEPSAGIKKFFTTPSAVVEGTIRSRGGLMTGRVNFPLTTFISRIENNGFEQPYRLGAIGLGLIYGF